MMATRQGMIKKTALSEFINMRRSGLIAIGLKDDDELIGVQLTNGQSDLMLATQKGMSIRFNETTIRATGRPSMGVRSMKLKKDDSIVSLCLVDEEKQVLCISENGYGKRTDISEYREQGRAGKGVTVMKLTDKTGDLATMLMVTEEDEIMMITDDGTIIRTPAKDIRECGRVTQGVRLMRVAEGSRIVDVDVAAPEDDEELLEQITQAPPAVVLAGEGEVQDSLDYEGAEEEPEEDADI